MTAFPLCAERVLLLGDYYYNLQIVRMLSNAGYPAVVAESVSGPHVCRYSRYTTHIFKQPPIKESESAFLSALIEYLESDSQVDLIFPTGDAQLSFLVRHSPELPGHVKLIMPDLSVTQACLNKPKMCSIAAGIGIPQAKMETVSSLHELTLAQECIGFPLIVKSADSNKPLFNQKCIICHSPKDLKTIFTEWPAGITSVIVQKFVRGLRHNVYFVSKEGQMLQSVETLALRTKKFNYTGNAVESVKVSARADLTDFTARLLHHLNYTGIGVAQFLVDGQTGQISFLELGPRITAATALPFICGLNLPVAAVELFRYGQLRTPIKVRETAGLRFHWTYGDLVGLWEAVSANEVRPLDALRWLGSSLLAFIRADIHRTWSWRDPAPTAVLYARLFSSHLLKSVRRQRRPS